MTLPLRSKVCAPSLKCIKRLQKEGYEAYWVGGSVRDVLLNRKPKDYDVVTSAKPRVIGRLFPKHLKVGKKFGIFIVTEFEKPVEVATFRKDLSYRDGRRPTGIKVATLEEDVKRRDFTVNGLLFDPINKKVIDHVGGRKDLSKKMIRTIGDPEKRFKEDHLRMLRAIRFSCRLKFRIEQKTWQAIVRCAPKIKRISAERIREELILILSSASADEGLRLLSKSGLLKAIMPEIEKMKGVKQSKKHHPEGDVFNHTCLVLKALKNPEPALVFAGLLHDVEKPSCRFSDNKGTHFYGHETKGVETAAKIMKRLKFSGEDIEKAGYLIKNHLRWYSAPDMRITRLHHHTTHPYFKLAVELLKADAEGSDGRKAVYRYIMTHIRKFSKMDSAPKPLIKGRDLIRMGISQGPIIGKILREIEEKRLDEELLTPQDAKKWVKKAYNTHIST